jgi:hypothetical protein
MYMDCDGVWARVNYMKDMRMSITGGIGGVTFYNINGRYNTNNP